jgi:putative NIF3 family GTP cyclohydrolase 1 type 2
LLVHHTTWASIDQVVHERKKELLRAEGVSLYGAHAALDCHEEFSNSSILASRLGLRVNGRLIQYAGGLAGVHGAVPGSFDEFAKRVSSELKMPVRAWKNSEKFGRVGIVPGGGAMTSYVAEAQSRGCDTYLTGEGSMYTRLFAREIGMNLIVATHYSTETYGVEALAAHVAARFGVPWHFVREDDPELVTGPVY